MAGVNRSMHANLSGGCSILELQHCLGNHSNLLSLPASIGAVFNLAWRILIRAPQNLHHELP
jgi:hypothetical protein